MLSKLIGQKLVAFWALFFCLLLSCNSIAQTPEIISNNLITTNNLITNPTFNGTNGWTTTGAVGGDGPTHPAVPANGNGYTFTYSQGSIAQTYAINQALANVGAGVQIGGFDYGFKYRFGCANAIGGYCENPTGIQDTLNATSRITSSTGETVYTRYYALGANAPAPYSATFSSVDTQQRFNSAMPIESLGSFSISFTGQDNGYWGGNYGPTIKDIYSKAVYTVDPCVANPMSSPSCAGYNNIVTSANIATQSYAINQALNLAGAGVQINGFQYGYHYYVGGDWCSETFLGIFCIGTSPSSMAIDVNVTSSTGSSLYTATHNHTAQNTGGQPSYSYVFPSQRLLSSMGNFSLSTREVGTTALYSSWSNWQYTPDFCVGNPLYAPSCPGYAEAYQTQQCTANPLYNSACPGYAEALFTQQCTANPLLSQSCPGYAAAYLNYQCSANPLYSTTCPGYEQAYLNSQCIKDSLFSPRCEGYNTAYAIKYLVTGIDSNAVNQSLSDTAATKANDPATIKVATNTASTTVNNDGTVSTGVSATGDTNVDKVITSKASTTNTAPAAVQLAPPPPAQQQMAQNESKGGGDKSERKGGNDKQEDKKDDAPKGTGGGSSPSNINTAQASSDKPTVPTVRQELQARREAAAKAEAVEKGKNLANEMGKVADMEQQKQIQNVVIQAMGFTPGFDAYSKQIIVQTPFYKPYQVYGNQKNVDNRTLGMGLYGPSEKLHNDLIDSQYNKGK
jgi:hypothetical protein